MIRRQAKSRTREPNRKPGTPAAPPPAAGSARKPQIRRLLEPSDNFATADDSPSPGGEGRGEGEQVPAMPDHRTSVSVPGSNARISGSGNSFVGAARTWFPGWLLTGVPALVTMVLYWPATGCGFVNYDDPDYFNLNPWVQAGLTWKNVGWAFTTAHAYNWHPVTWLSLMLDVNLFGTAPPGCISRTWPSTRSMRCWSSGCCGG